MKKAIVALAFAAAVSRGSAYAQESSPQPPEQVKFYGVPTANISDWLIEVEAFAVYPR